MVKKARASRPKRECTRTSDVVARPSDDAVAEINEEETQALPSLANENLCRFYVLQNGNCKFGNECRYSHDLKGLSFQDAKQYIPCPYFQKGGCRYGEFCQLSHTVSKKKGECCAICLEDPTEKNQKYGLLSSCDHVFCFPCLMEWRTEGAVETKKCCPACRKHSDYVVPSEIYASDPNEKNRIVKAYKDKLNSTPCTRFTGRLGSCRFGSDCFYLHLDEDGNDVKSEDHSMAELQEAREKRRRGRNLPRGPHRGEFDGDIGALIGMLDASNLSMLWNIALRMEEPSDDDDYWMRDMLSLYGDHDYYDDDV